MRDSFEAGGLLRNVKRCSVDDRLAWVSFDTVERAAVVLTDAPGWIVGRRGDDADFVATLGKPGGHLACVFSDPCKLGGVVEAVDQDPHWCSVRRFGGVRYCTNGCLTFMLGTGDGLRDGYLV